MRPWDASFYRRFFAEQSRPLWQALVALRRVLLAQFSAFPLNGADLYEELKTSTAILSTGIGSLGQVTVGDMLKHCDKACYQEECMVIEGLEKGRMWSGIGTSHGIEEASAQRSGRWRDEERSEKEHLGIPSFPEENSRRSLLASDVQRQNHLDKLLDAGLYTGEVTEIVGGPGSGKTQVCLCVAANVAHGLQQNVLYVDSSGGLTASRLLQLLQAKTQDEEEQAEALQRIQVVYAFDIFQMLDVLQELRGTVVQQVTGSSGTVKVVVVDSVTAVVSPLLGGQQREGLGLMMQLARELKTLARDLGMAVVVTNHITRDRDSGRLKPALGRSWSFVPSTRILLDTINGAGASGGQRMACLIKSPRQPTGFQEMVDIGTWGTSEQSTMLQVDWT
ncbi:DNA repair protein rad51d [Saguinus oedipus]|uniref:DNA repair protein rad51d n=1 Tax=Saguinus oedipus TaxID=9490 RepID=A0ABQ9VR83_SAGOE|nr:DNA repair protein rad51d [Saguinus oedipus]